MPAYMSKGAGVLTVVRTEHRLGLRELTLALYHSTEELGEEMKPRDVRQAIAGVLAMSGKDVFNDMGDYLREGLDLAAGGSLVGSEISERLEWARRMVLKAYRRDFSRFPNELAAFEALPADGIV